MNQAFRFRGSLHGLKIDTGRFTKDLDKQAQVLVKQAARAFVRAAVPLIPVWSGHALGSLKFASGINGNLGRALNIAIPISPKPNSWRKGKNQYAGGKFGRYNFTAQRHIYTFLFRSDVLHLFLNNFFARTGNVKEQIVAPWGALEAGDRAFQDYVQANSSKLPKIGDYIVKTVITEISE